MPFPAHFTWGAAASSYQIEGAAETRGRCVWDELCDVEGAVFEGHSAATACDHVGRFAEDVALLRDLGATGYRLSLSWPRLQPAGVGPVDRAGLDFYERLVDALLEAGVTPWITLFHWDYPTALYHRGGWLNPDSPQWFADYAAIAVRALGDRVTRWMTHNEPQCFVGLGHRDGIHAPGLKLGWPQVLRVGHNALLAHGRAVEVMRAVAPQTLQIGWAPVGVVQFPATDSKADIEAARNAMFSVPERTIWTNTWFSDPVCLGHYPEDGLQVFGKAVPKFTESEMEQIAQPLDFYGVNVYQGTRVRAKEDGKAVAVKRPPGSAWTHFDWPVTPEALYWGPRFLAERYGLPIAITENGLASCDWVSLDGAVHDPQRIDYTRRHLLELERAIDDGVDVRGYFHWSILDNFEWAEGYRRRFGLVHVDFETLARTPKDSYAWYREVIRSNGQTLLV